MKSLLSFISVMLGKFDQKYLENVLTFLTVFDWFNGSFAVKIFCGGDQACGKIISSNKSVNPGVYI